MNEKAKKLYECYNKFIGHTTENAELAKLCTLVTQKLSDEEYEFMVSYMSNELYPSIQDAVETSMQELYKEMLNGVGAQPEETKKDYLN